MEKGMSIVGGLVRQNPKQLENTPNASSIQDKIYEVTLKSLSIYLVYHCWYVSQRIFAILRPASIRTVLNYYCLYVCRITKGVNYFIWSNCVIIIG